MLARIGKPLTIKLADQAPPTHFCVCNAMPKRSLETDVDGEWVGRSVMLKASAARGKRLPETMVAKICRVTRHATNAAVLLEYSANGATKTYTDIFPCCEALATRYIKVQEAAAPLEKEQFLRDWCYQGPARSAPRSGQALSEILPAFQLKTNINVAPTVGASAPDARRAAVAAVLACSIQPFQFAELFRASCGDLNFETSIEAVRAEAHMRIQRDCHLEGLLHRSAPQEEAMRRLGRCTLHPWQAAVLARIMQLSQNPEKMLASHSARAVHGAADRRSASRGHRHGQDFCCCSSRAGQAHVLHRAPQFDETVGHAGDIDRGASSLG